jgi:arylsulfatase A-like enzyme
MPADRPTLMGALSEAGYRTHGVGKMHFTPDPYASWGFQTRDIGEEFGSVADDHYLQFLADRGFAHVERPHGLRSEMYYVPQLSPVPEPLHYSRCRDGGEDRRLLQLIQAYYLACVSFVDAQIARILAELPDDTVVVLSADHGEFLGDYGYFGKRSFLDPAARVPLVCAGPGFAPGHRSDELVSLVDIAPTLLAAAGLAPGHFADLADSGFDTANVPLALGGADEAATLPAIARDPDAGFLTIPDDDLAPEDTFAEYRHRYREGEKP